ESRYATLFFGTYDDATRRLEYANCGHHPPFVFRVRGTVEPLTATATVLGLFEDWNTSVCHVTLQPGDAFVLYTDGVVEATNAQDEPFDSTRLIDIVWANRHLSAASLVRSIQSAVQDFSGGIPTDDLTVVVANARDE